MTGQVAVRTSGRGGHDGKVEHVHNGPALAEAQNDGQYPDQGNDGKLTPDHPPHVVQQRNVVAPQTRF
jgi:hypothetical protein